MNSSLDQLVVSLAGQSALDIVLALQHDQDQRWQAGERVLVETYLSRFPTLHEEPEHLLVLILNEVQQRETRQEIITKQEYYERFPMLQKQLELQLQFHSFLKESDLVEAVDIADERDVVGEAETYSLQSTLDDAPAKYEDAPVVDETTRKVGRFILRKELGQGSFGIVYRAYDPTLERDVALKIPKRTDRQKEVERFVREAQAAAKLQHPNIVTVFDCSAEPGASFIAMEWVDGVPLHTHVEKYRPSHQQVAKWLRDLALALHAAHEQGLLHRDVKPANIMVDRNNRVRLMDFGLARKQRQLKAATTDDSPDLTQEGALVGTPSYMSPEQAEGRTDLTFATDQFSLGIVGYELLTEKRPYTGKLEMLIGKLRDPHFQITPLREQDAAIAYGLEAILMKTLSRKPAERYASMSELAVDLHRWLKGEEVSAPLVVAKKSWRCPSCQRLNAKSKSRCVYCKHHLSGGVPEDWTKQSVIKMEHRRERRQHDELEPRFRIRFWEWTLLVVFIGLLVLVPKLHRAERNSILAGRASFSLHEVGGAFANYMLNGFSAPADIVDKQTKKPLLSWRVALLPWLEKAQLYQQFHLDEPWDSEHNIKLLAEMPEIYDPRLPATWLSNNTDAIEPYTTTVQGFTSPGALLEPGKKIRYASISDGTKNTLALVHARKAVLWTKPADLADDAPTLPPLGPSLGDTNPETFFAVFCDSSVYQLDQKANPADIRMLITIAGGEYLEVNKVAAKNPVPVPRQYYRSPNSPTTVFPSYRPKHWSEFGGWITFYLMDHSLTIWYTVLGLLVLLLAKLAWVWNFYRRQRG